MRIDQLRKADSVCRRSVDTVVLDTQSFGRFALLTVLRCVRTPNGSVSVGIPALPALRVDGSPDYEGRYAGGAENLAWLIQNQVASPGGAVRCRVCRPPTELVSKSVAASYPEARQANYCNCRKLCGRLMRTHNRARFEFVPEIEFNRKKKG